MNTRVSPATIALFLEGKTTHEEAEALRRTPALSHGIAPSAGRQAARSGWFGRLLFASTSARLRRAGNVRHP
jgi:hypothetical protein